MSRITLSKVLASSVPTPAANGLSLFADSSDGIFAVKNDAGVVTSLRGPEGPEGPEGPPGAIPPRRGRQGHQVGLFCLCRAGSFLG